MTKRLAAMVPIFASLIASVWTLGCEKKQPVAEAAPNDQTGTAAATSKKTLTIWWAQWAPADGLQELAGDFARKENVDVKVHQIPWANFQDQVFQEFGKNRTAFDVVVGDSQWLGRGATKNLYVDLTDWLPSAVDLTTLHPVALRYLAEYPTGSSHYYGAPAETDAMGWAYRKDWFDDPAVKDAFKKRYKKDLAVPDTWGDLRQIAEFFTEPEKKRYGNVLVTGRGYDDIVMGFEQVLYAFGGSWGDAKTFKVEGALDSPEAVAGLEFFKGLLKYAPPGGSKLGYGEALEPFVNNSTAMLMNYFAFFPDLAKKMSGKVGFFAMPKEGDRRFASLGGQGFSISSKVPAAQQDLAKKFIAWFLQADTQNRWVQKPGGFTANAGILKSDDFKKASAYNAAFAESMDIAQDFWNVPAYNELIAVAAQHLGEALDGKKSSRDALASMAAEHQKILRATP
ncbi:MAG: sugar ABC transporter substrate-binding protein [Myxococcota bacterium]|nr:sugar ABC transporter substrate-binding protein [Myxococcota bacterium]